MWQRAQTLYIAIATVLIAVMFFSVKAVIPASEGNSQEELRYTAYLPYLILLIVITAFNFIALNAFKFRVFQMRTTVLAAIVTLALQIWLAVDFVSTHSVVNFRISAVFPAIALILDVMAIRGIAADILVADSVNRLRSSRKHHRRK
ncbi:MAG: DUF4293 family protein [Bacteroidia bacterium]|nr:DUF4293 family protein [Bacteroidia bacterium]